MHTSGMGDQKCDSWSSVGSRTTISFNANMINGKRTSVSPLELLLGFYQCDESYNCLSMPRDEKQSNSIMLRWMSWVRLCGFSFRIWRVFHVYLGVLVYLPSSVC